MKLKVTFVLFLVFSTLSVPTSQAATKAGSPCKVLNATVSSGGFQFKCVKSGKKLVWSKGKKLKIQSPDIAVSSSPAVTPNSEPGTVPVVLVPTRPTSFSDLVEKSKGMTYWAWKIAQERKASRGTNPVDFVIHVGPNTKMIVNDPRAILEMTSGFFPNFPQAKTAHVVFFDYPDVAWAQELDQQLSARPRPREISDSCNSASLCNGGNAYVDPKGVGFSYISASSTNKDTFQSFGPVVSHEYFHNLQMYLLEVEKVKGAPVVYMPDWFREGSAHWFSVSLLNENYELVLDYQKSNAEVDLYQTRFTASQVSRVLSVNDGRSDNGWLAYNVGSKAIEALVLIKGIDSILEMYVEGSRGTSFESAFQKIYGMSWNEAKPILSEAISRIYQ